MRLYYDILKFCRCLDKGFMCRYAPALFVLISLVPKRGDAKYVCLYKLEKCQLLEHLTQECRGKHRVKGNQEGNIARNEIKVVRGRRRGTRRNRIWLSSYQSSFTHDSLISTRVYVETDTGALKMTLRLPQHWGGWGIFLIKTLFTMTHG
jgi:hypothetical protein